MNILHILLLSVLLLLPETSKPIDNHTQTDTMSVVGLNNLARNYLDSDPNKSREYAILARDRATSEEDNYELSNALNYIGLSYYNQKQYKEAINYFQQSSRVSLRLGARDKVGNLFQKIGMSYIELKDYPKAIFYYQQTVKIYEQLGYNDYAASTYFDLGVVYFLAREYSNAINALSTAITYYTQNNNIRGTAKTHNQIGITYQEMGNLKEALNHFKQALRIHEMFHNSDQMAFILNKIGQVYINLKQFDNAIETLKKAHNYCNPDYHELISIIHLNIGRVFLFQKEFSAAEKEFNKSLETADKLQNRHLLSDIYSNLYQLHLQTNDNRKALLAYQKHIYFKGSIDEEVDKSAAQSANIYSEYNDNLYIAIMIVLVSIIIGLVAVVVKLKRQHDAAFNMLIKHNIMPKDDKSSSK